MSAFSLFIHYPLAKSLSDALTTIDHSELFSSHVLPLDSDLATLVLEAKPCVCVLSVLDHKSRHETKAFLECLRATKSSYQENFRDPTVRIIVLAEGKGIAIENWSKYGIHEYWISPFTPTVALHKLARHYHKALAHEFKDQSDSKILEETDAAKVEETADAKLYYMTAGEDNAAKRFVERFRIKLEMPGVDPKYGNWNVSNDPKDEEGFDDVWTWTYEDPSKKGQVKWYFRGDRPVFKNGMWFFSGEQPKLYSFTKKK
jgi:hypothetical protein